MGWKGLIRSVAAAERRYQRDLVRQNRQAERVRKLQEKLDELEHAQLLLAQYKERIEQLTGIHHTCGEGVKWGEMLEVEAPEKPIQLYTNRTIAECKLANFKPTIFDRILGRVQTKRACLELDVTRGEERDAEEYQQASTNYERLFAEHQNRVALAQAVMEGDVEAYASAIEDLTPFGEIQDIGCQISVNLVDRATARIELGVEADDVVPKEILSVTKSGKLSQKNMPIGKFNELYQDYVCGCALRVGRELFSILPLSIVTVDVSCRMLNSATGRIAPQVILSVALVRETMSEILFENADPSDAMKLFVHRMGFRKSQGFSSVVPLTDAEISKA
ncbi:hypothetical protein GC207_15095 [bacterium]|nr:hypothetical protein [bacterium]